MKNKFKVYDRVECIYRKVKYGIIIDVKARGDRSPLCYVLFLKDRTGREYIKPFIKTYDAACLKLTDVNMTIPEKYKKVVIN